MGHSVVGVGVRQGARKPRHRDAGGDEADALDAKAVTYAGNGASRPHIEAMLRRWVSPTP